MAKSLQAMRDVAVRKLLFEGPKAGPEVDAFLDAAAAAPYGGVSGRREQCELEVLHYAIPRARGKTGALARRMWMRLLTEWTAHAPKAGQQQWYELARAHRELAVRVPAKLRPSVRRAWALGRLYNAKGERVFASFYAARTPEAKLEALRAIAAKAAPSKRFEFWECICAALVVLGDPDRELATTCLARWKATDGANAEPSLYEATR
jgi:hypothetical protein